MYARISVAFSDKKRLAANPFELPIRRRRERARDGVALDVRHALDAADRDGIVNAAGDGLIADAHRGASGGASSFDGHGFDSGEARVVRDQAAELLLLRENSGEHVADV